MSPRTSPASTLRSRPSTAATPPKRLARPRISRSALMAGAELSHIHDGGPRHGPPNPPTLVAPRETRGAPRSSHYPPNAQRRPGKPGALLDRRTTRPTLGAPRRSRGALDQPLFAPDHARDHP